MVYINRKQIRRKSSKVALFVIDDPDPRIKIICFKHDACNNCDDSQHLSYLAGDTVQHMLEKSPCLVLFINHDLSSIHSYLEVGNADGILGTVSSTMTTK